VGTSGPDRVRVDKWLWAARFFKTRSLASQAVEGGRVRINGDRVKAARPLRPGDRLEVRRGAEVVEVLVVELSEQRGPASAAQALYRETEASVTRRTALAEQQRGAAAAAPRFPGRPDKKSRRALDRLMGRDR